MVLISAGDASAPSGLLYGTCVTQARLRSALGFLLGPFRAYGRGGARPSQPSHCINVRLSIGGMIPWMEVGGAGSG